MVIEWVTLAISASAIIFSILSYRNSKNTLISDVITKQRATWIESLREAVADYLEYFLDDNHDKKKLLVKKCRIELYMNKNNKEHKGFILSLDKCMSAGKNEKKEVADELIAAAQNVINCSWRRMKVEAGQTPKSEIKREAILRTKAK